MKTIVEKVLAESIAELCRDGVWASCGEAEVSVERPKDIMHGDWTTNVCFVLSKIVKKAPLLIAEELVQKIREKNTEHFSDIQAVQPGYINFTLQRNILCNEMQKIISDDRYGAREFLKGKTIMVEYTQPNPFKPFHIGHLMSNTIGESLSRIIEFCGAKVIRANYQGDVGPHVAKSLWAIQKFGYDITDIDEIGKAYAKGHDAYMSDENAKAEIHAINKAIYLCSDESLMQLYAAGRTKTLERFEEIYAILGTKFDVYYFESETWRRGEQIVREHMGNIFEESDGAVIFDGEKYGLHKRVFITGQGLPTYEAKEIGLAMIKKETNPSDEYFVTTAVEQEEYFKVVQKALELVDPTFSGKIRHVTHGMMQLTSGKMSSRKGNVVTGETLIADAQEMAQKKMSERSINDTQDKTINAIAVAGIKFSILKQHIGKNVVYEPESALSFDGDSGPYLQYTYARCRSVIIKAQEQGIVAHIADKHCEESILIERLLTQFPEVVERAYEQSAPHIIANYLIECARTYNAYYAHTIIVDETQKELSAYRVGVTTAVAYTIEKGLKLLGISVVEHM